MAFNYFFKVNPFGSIDKMSVQTNFDLSFKTLINTNVFGNI